MNIDELQKVELETKESNTLWISFIVSFICMSVLGYLFTTMRFNIPQLHVDNPTIDLTIVSKKPQRIVRKKPQCIVKDTHQKKYRTPKRSIGLKHCRILRRRIFSYRHSRATIHQMVQKTLAFLKSPNKEYLCRITNLSVCLEEDNSKGYCYEAN